MWKVVYIAPNRPIAVMLQGLVRDSGSLTMLRPIVAPHLGDSASGEILVPESEAEEASEVIAASFG